MKEKLDLYICKGLQSIKCQDNPALSFKTSPLLFFWERRRSWSCVCIKISITPAVDLYANPTYLMGSRKKQLTVSFATPFKTSLNVSSRKYFLRARSRYVLRRSKRGLQVRCQSDIIKHTYAHIREFFLLLFIIKGASFAAQNIKIHLFSFTSPKR